MPFTFSPSLARKLCPTCRFTLLIFPRSSFLVFITLRLTSSARALEFLAREFDLFFQSFTSCCKLKQLFCSSLRLASDSRSFITFLAIMLSSFSLDNLFTPFFNSELEFPVPELDDPTASPNDLHPVHVEDMFEEPLSLELQSLGVESTFVPWLYFLPSISLSSSLASIKIFQGSKSKSLRVILLQTTKSSTAILLIK